MTKGIVCIGILCAMVSVASADEAKKESGPPAFHIGPTAMWVLLGGVTTGGTVALSDKGYFVGGEVSAALLKVDNFIGIYGDGYYDWGANGTYFTGGLELGHKFLGVDGGAAVRFDDGETRVGLAGRVSVGVGVAQIYVRYMHFPTRIGHMTIPNDDVLQVGLELKLPFHTIASE
ncbi:MAG TPA: hypothetical protein VL326_02140 [Kofleriaceae bacterium]|nr:hypothetical protein [Kofleriaceae bacterium]